MVYSGSGVVDVCNEQDGEPDSHDLALMVSFSLHTPPRQYDARVEEGRCLSYNRAEYRALFQPDAIPAFTRDFEVAEFLNRSFHETDTSGVDQLIWSLIEGNWEQIQSVVKERWDALTDDDLIVIAGNRERLSQKLQERYGYENERAEQELEDFTGVSEFRHGYS